MLELISSPSSRRERRGERHPVAMIGQVNALGARSLDESPAESINHTQTSALLCMYVYIYIHEIQKPSRPIRIFRRAAFFFRTRVLEREIRVYKAVADGVEMGIDGEYAARPSISIYICI